MLSVSGTMLKNLSGARNIRLGLLALGLTPAEVSAKYQEAIEISGLRDSIHYPVSTYSSGMRARLKFAIAVAKVPDILLVDEALGTGDAKFTSKSRKLLEDIHARAGAVLMVNHTAAAIADACQRVLWLERGVLRADGPVADVLEMYSEYQKTLKK